MRHNETPLNVKNSVTACLPLQHKPFASRKYLSKGRESQINTPVYEGLAKVESVVNTKRWNIDTEHHNLLPTHVTRVEKRGKKSAFKGRKKYKGWVTSQTVIRRRLVVRPFKAFEKPLRGLQKIPVLQRQHLLSYRRTKHLSTFREV